MEWFRNGTLMQHDPTKKDAQDIRAPLITWRVSSRKPSMEVKPRVRESINNPNDPGRTMIMTGKVFDTQIIFHIYGTDNKQANDISEELEQFLHRYQGYLQQQGVGRIIFQDYREPEEYDNYRTGLVCRELSYLFVIERVFMTPVGEISFPADGVITTITTDINSAP